MFYFKAAIGWTSQAVNAGFATKGIKIPAGKLVFKFSLSEFKEMLTHSRSGERKESLVKEHGEVD